MHGSSILRITCYVLTVLVLSHRAGVCQIPQPDTFPVVTQFSPVPSGKGWKGEEGPLSEEVLRDTIDNILAHGFSGIEAPTHRPAEEEAFILQYAQSKGMFITYHAGALELFGRTAPPDICVYSPEYASAVRAHAAKQLAPLKNIPHLYNAFIYQDEPFHWGPQSFGYNDEVKAEFLKRYGYELPADLETIHEDPRKWQDVIDFRSSYFPDGWRQVYAITKQINPDLEAAARMNEREGFLFIINHEGAEAATTVHLADLPFSIGTIVDLNSDQPVAFHRDDQGVITLDASAPLGEVLLYHLKPAEESANTASQQNRNASFTLWQLPNQTRTQMMSYVIRTPHDKVIVIDGGNVGDAPYLSEFLKGLGNTVDAWFITHAHSDHFDALGEILAHPGSLKINALYGSLPTQAWMDQVGTDSEKESFHRFDKFLAERGRTVTELALGQEMEIDGVRIEALGVRNPEITRNAVNNSSLVLRMSDAAKSVLFLADLGVEGGDKLLNSPLAARLPSDYVQMAHHGQNGVNEAFYQRVQPTYCLWPTPDWLWDNDNGGGRGSGPWRTLEVRAWMDKLAVKTHYAMFRGMATIE